MRKKVIMVAVLVALLALPVAVYAQEPEVAVNQFVDMVNSGDVTAASAMVAEDAVVEAPQAMSGAEAEAEVEGGDPSVEVQHVGKAEVEAWIEGHVSAGGNTSLGECTVEGEVSTCGATFTSNRLTAMGVNEIEGTLAIQVNAEGQIVAYNFSPTAESAAALSAAGAAAAAEAAEVAAPTTMPTTGGFGLLPYALVVALGGLTVAGGLGLQRIGRRED